MNQDETETKRPLIDADELMKKQLARKHEQDRRNLWISVATAYASAANSTSLYAMESWANSALADYDKKFPNPIP